MAHRQADRQRVARTPAGHFTGPVFPRPTIGLLLPAVALVIALGGPAARRVQAQEPLPEIQAPLLKQAFRQRWLHAGLVQGRIRVATTRFGAFNVSRPTGAGSEKLQVQATGGKVTLKYEMTREDYKLLVEIDGAESLRIDLQVPGEREKSVTLVQPVDGPITLSIDEGGKVSTYKGDSLWFLMLVQPRVAGRWVVPLVRAINEQWDLEQIAGRIEQSLVQIAAEQSPPDLQQWSMLVAQLGDPSFSVRQRADWHLRRLGPLVRPYLEHLDWSRLDAEQRFRLRRILVAIGQNADDEQPEQVARSLAGDPATWLALLERSEQPVREQAARWLAALLGGPIQFDPAASAEVRQEQIEQLRTRVAAW